VFSREVHIGHIVGRDSVEAIVELSCKEKKKVQHKFLLTNIELLIPGLPRAEGY
jgi:hypothetical protein